MTSLILSLIILSLIAFLVAIYTFLVELTDDEEISINNMYLRSYHYRLDKFIANPDEYIKYNSALTERN